MLQIGRFRYKMVFMDPLLGDILFGLIDKGDALSPPLQEKQADNVHLGQACN